MAKPEAEMSIGVEFTAIAGLDATMRRVAGNLRPTPPSVKFAKWPNVLGESPKDAIGKAVRVEIDGRGTEYRVGAVSGETLILEHVSGWDRCET